MTKKDDKTIDMPAAAPAATGTALMTWKEKMAAVTAQAAVSEQPKGGYLSFKGGNISYGDELVPGNKINVVVADFMFENYHYKDKYVAGKTGIPDCYAFGRMETDLTPHEDVESPINPQCGTPGEPGCCPYNEWGSSFDGGRGKACSNSRRVAVIDADSLKRGPEGVKRASLIQFKIPVTSTVNFSKFVNQCTKILSKHPMGVVAELSTKPHPTSLFQVHWKIMEEIQGDELMEAIYARHTAASNLLSQPYRRAEEEEESAKPASKKF